MVLLCCIQVFMITLVLNPKGAEGHMLLQTWGEGIGGDLVVGASPPVALRVLTRRCSGLVLPLLGL